MFGEARLQRDLIARDLPLMSIGMLPEYLCLGGRYNSVAPELLSPNHRLNQGIW